MKKYNIDDYNETDIAIVGLAGKLPQSDSIDEYWQNILNNNECITFFTEHELLNDNLSEDTFKNSDYVKAKGIISDVDLFDNEFFNFSSLESKITDPQQRLFLETVWNGLENASLDPDTYPGLIGVFAGSSINTYLLQNIINNKKLIDLAGWYQLLIGNGKDFLATRTSYLYNLKGPCLTIQTACSTSLVAVHTACQSLLYY